MMSPPLRFNVAPRRKAFLLVWFWHRQSRMVNLESRLEVFVICFCCGHVGNFFLRCPSAAACRQRHLLRPFGCWVHGFAAALTVEGGG
jgi:hypothetical protein